MLYSMLGCDLLLWLLYWFCLVCWCGLGYVGYCVYCVFDLGFLLGGLRVGGCWVDVWASCALVVCVV